MGVTGFCFWARPNPEGLACPAQEGTHSKQYKKFFKHTKPFLYCNTKPSQIHGPFGPFLLFFGPRPLGVLFFVRGDFKLDIKTYPTGQGFILELDNALG